VTPSFAPSWTAQTEKAANRFEYKPIWAGDDVTSFVSDEKLASVGALEWT
jgi:hypothetical protein